MSTLTFTQNIPIYYEDTDFSGYVYHANYLKFFERAREEFFGAPFLRELFTLGFHFVVSEANLRFHKPAQHADILRIESLVSYSPSPVVPFEQKAYQEASGQLLVTGHIKLVMVNKKGAPVRLPEIVLERFASHAKQ